MNQRLCWLELSWRQVGQTARDALVRATPSPSPPTATLATCARVCWLLAGPQAEPEARRLAAEIQSRLGVLPILRAGPAALHRALTVAAGLDSAAEGELDIGRQAVAALETARLAHPEAPFALIEHVLYRLLRAGRRAGWIRARLGVPEAATAFALARQPGSVGLVGAGAMGERVQVALTRAGAPFGWYNRTPRPGVRGLDALGAHEVWILASGAPAPWFLAPSSARLVVDLGQPPQVLPGDPRSVSLDALLDAAALRLPEAQRAQAHAAVDAATTELLERLRRRPPLAPRRAEVRP